MNFLNKAFAYTSLGMGLFALVPVLASQLKSISTLNADLVWDEVAPMLMQISGAVGHPINMVLAEKITRNSIAEIKAFTPGVTA